MSSAFHLDNDGVYRVPAFERFEWLEHGFGTRRSAGWPDPSRVARPTQIHSATVLTATNGAGVLGPGDAVVSNRPGVLVGVRTADCVPILMADAATPAVAAVHAGWRGTAQEIVLCTISELAGQFGTLPRDLYAAIGPAIGRCCYEVGPEVARQFARWWPEFDATNRHVHLDLVETNRRQLIDAGVSPERIFAGAPCTCCSDGALESYRRDKERSGRMISAIGIVPTD